MAQDVVFVSAALQSWKQAVDRADKMFAGFSDEELQLEVAPGRNRLYYLLGHLTAVHNRLLPLLRLGGALNPELDEQFVATPDRKFAGEEAKAADVRAAWKAVNARLWEGFATLTPEQWLERHASVSEEDFAKEPHRNRLSVLFSRTNHVAFHLGQVRLAK